ncbi:MAG: LUD domain-containing protein [Chloroflexota bacterium]
MPPFDQRYRKALDDPELRVTLLAFQRRWVATRAQTMAELGIDFEAGRQKLAVIKDDVIQQLPEYIRQFTAQAERLGASVHTAGTAEEAVAQVIALAEERGIRRIVKSKSMVSEEITLNRGLEAAGLQITETDLGEWLVQLAGERPSHIIAPAIHKNRRQIGRLLSRVTGRAVSEVDIAEQVGAARGALREEFLEAQMGISGANALIAETGTVMLVTNEGNAELVTSLPPIHVVLVGIEKLLPALENAALELELLTPSATGQPATAYVSWITGPGAAGQELHIVLIDNGRSAMRESPLFASALRCIRCGACSNVCPSYGVVGGHVFGYVYSGAIGLVNTPFHHGIEADAGPQSLCVSCNACQTVCPVDIPLPRQILDARAWTNRVEGQPLSQRLALAVWLRPKLARVALRAGTLLQKPFQHGAFLDPPGASKLTSWRRLPAVARRPFRDTWQQLSPATKTGAPDVLAGVRVAYFVQCLTDWLYPEMGEAIVRTLRAFGAEVQFPAAQHCCGLPAYDSGNPDAARRLARQTIETLEHSPADYIVSGGVSCVIAMLHDYDDMFAEEPEWQMRARRLAERTLDFTSFMDRVARLPAGSLATAPPQRAVYHYFCQAYNVMGMREEPRRLLGEVCGLDLVPLAEANVCCGFGGSVSFKRPELCRHILDRKLDNVLATGVDLLITDNPGCIMQLRGGLAARHAHVRVLHTADVVAERVWACLSP